MTSFVAYIAVAACVAVVAAAVSFLLARRPTLRQRFDRLDLVTGRTRSEIVAAVGRPTSVSLLPSGKQVCRWKTDNYRIALQFQGDVCECVTD